MDEVIIVVWLNKVDIDSRNLRDNDPFLRTEQHLRLHNFSIYVFFVLF
jgi:hypothetical protein